MPTPSGSRGAEDPARLRVGSVPYFVARPLDFGLSEDCRIDYSQDTPAKLVAKLRSGELDVALASSVELFQRPGYGYLDGLAIAGRGVVSSVKLFLRCPVTEIRSLALDPASRTAAALVRIALDPGFRTRCPRAGLEPIDFLDLSAEEDPRLKTSDAWLRIGDPALQEYFGHRPPPSFDPTQAWTNATGLPFAFAVWIVGPGIRIEDWAIDAFRRARENGKAQASTVAGHAAETLAIPREDCRRYLLDECVFELDRELAPVLDSFQLELARIGLCRGGLEPAAIPLCEHHASPAHRR